MPTLKSESQRTLHTQSKLQNERFAWSLYVTGTSYDEIADELCVLRITAVKLVRAYRKRIYRSDLRLDRAVSLERLHKLLAAIWPLCMKQTPSESNAEVPPNLHAVAEARAIIAEVNKMLGLYAPTRTIDTRLQLLVSTVARAEGLDERAVVESILRHLPELGEGA